MQPLAILLGSQLIIAVSTIFIFILLLIIYKFKLKRYLYIFIVIITIVFLVNYFIYDSREVTLIIYWEFLLKSCSLFIIGSFPFKTYYLKKYFYTFSIINFISLASIIFLGYIESISYMRFGYAMLPTVLVSIYALYENRSKKLIWLILIILSFLLMFIYGSRGPLLGLLIFLIIILFFNANVTIVKKILFLMLLILSYVYLFIFNGIGKFLDFLYFDLNFKTYSIIKLRMMIDRGLAESSSGRDELYKNFSSQILENPIFGNGIGITQELWGITPHNIFLQTLLEFGIIGLVITIVLGILYINILAKIRKADNNLFFILAIILSVSVGRLLISSDLWLRQELWLLISMSINAYIITKNV